MARFCWGGNFTAINGTARNRIARLNANGSLENTTTFNPGTGATGAQFNGLVAAWWCRPEISQVTFELSTDGGSNWSGLGTGTRTVGGWQLTGLSLPADGSLRARGRTASGGYVGNASSLIEALATFGMVPPFQSWKQQHLGDLFAPDLGDIDHDGLVHVVEYALLLPPNTPSQSPGVSVFPYPEGNRLRMFVPRDPTHNDITVSVEATADLIAGTWTPLATSTLGAPFTGPGYVGGDDATPGMKTVEVRDLVNISSTTQRWMRVNVTH